MDTNVIVSGIFFGGVPRSVLEAWAEGSFELIFSPAILDEYLKTCEQLSAAHPNLAVRGVLLRLIGEGTLVPDTVSEEAITRDRDDDKFMLCAFETGATVVSGDRDLLAVSGWCGVGVYTPRRFLDRLESPRE